MKRLNKYINDEQQSKIDKALNGPDGDLIQEKLTTIENTIGEMEVIGICSTCDYGSKIIRLHYSVKAFDWWIFEIGNGPDSGLGIGFMCLNNLRQHATVGPFQFSSILKVGAELDIFWQPAPLKQIISAINPRCELPKETVF